MKENMIYYDKQRICFHIELQTYIKQHKIPDMLLWNNATRKNKNYHTKNQLIRHIIKNKLT